MSDAQSPIEARHDELVQQVATVLERSGYWVEPYPSLEGLELDLILGKADDPAVARIAVEVKVYSRLVGLRTIRSFGAVGDFLRGEGLVRDGWLITTRGFTTNAQRYAEHHRIQLWTVGDLYAEFGTPALRSDSPEPDVRMGRPHGRKRVFVIMPFDDEMNDVFILGIRWAAQKVGVVAVRADELEHNGEIIGEIQHAIRSFDGVLGDTTGANPNVCYEVGYAHALGRPTILICKRGETLPFDIRGVNHLMYRSIVELRERLPGKLKATLGLR